MLFKVLLLRRNNSPVSLVSMSQRKANLSAFIAERA